MTDLYYMVNLIGLRDFLYITSVVIDIVMKDLKEVFGVFDINH